MRFRLPNPMWVYEVYVIIYDVSLWGLGYDI